MQKWNKINNSVDDNVDNAETTNTTCTLNSNIEINNSEYLDTNNLSNDISNENTTALVTTTLTDESDTDTDIDSSSEHIIDEFNDIMSDISCDSHNFDITDKPSINNEVLYENSAITVHVKLF